MKITAIRATPINLPIEAPYLVVLRLAAGLLARPSSRSRPTRARRPRRGRLLHACDTDRRSASRPALSAATPSTSPAPSSPACRAGAACRPSTDFGAIRAFAAIEMALWDIRGKAWNRPLYDLLGGAVRKEIAFTDYFGFRQRERQGRRRDYAGSRGRLLPRPQREHGTTFFEGKLCTRDPAAEHRACCGCCASALGPGADAAHRLQHGLFADRGAAHRGPRSRRSTSATGKSPCADLRGDGELLRQHTAHPVLGAQRRSAAAPWSSACPTPS